MGAHLNSKQPTTTKMIYILLLIILCGFLLAYWIDYIPTKLLSEETLEIFVTSTYNYTNRFQGITPDIWIRFGKLYKYSPRIANKFVAHRFRNINLEYVKGIFEIIETSIYWNHKGLTSEGWHQIRELRDKHNLDIKKIVVLEQHIYQTKSWRHLSLSLN